MKCHVLKFCHASVRNPQCKSHCTSQLHVEFKGKLPSNIEFIDSTAQGVGSLKTLFLKYKVDQGNALIISITTGYHQDSIKRHNQQEYTITRMYSL